MNKNFLLFLFGLIGILFSCNSAGNKKMSGTEDKNLIAAVNRLKSDSFYEDSTNAYRQLFFSYFNPAMESGKYENARNLLVAFGEGSATLYDSVFSEKAVAFMNKKYPLPVDSQYAMLCHYISWNYFLGDDLPNTEYWARKSIAACTFPDAGRALSYGYHDLAGYFVNSNKVDSALYYFLESLKFYEKNNDKKSMASAYFNVGSCYYALYAYDESAKYVRKSCNLERESRDTSNWLGDEMFFPMNDDLLKQDTATTLAQVDHILNVYNHYTNANLTDTFLIHILKAKKYIYAKQFADADKELKECERINKRLVDYTLTSYIYDLKVQSEFSSQGRLTNTEFWKDKAAEYRENGALYDAANMYSLLAQSAEKTGNFEEFRKMKHEEEIMKDSVYANNIKGQVFKLDKKYQSEQKQQRIMLQEKTIQAKSRLNGFLIASLIGLCLITAVFFLVQRQRKLKQERQNNMYYTKQLLEKTEEERKRIATDLHDSISHELMNLKSATAENFETVHSRIDVIINDIRIISRNLHPVLFERVGLASTIEQMVDRVQQQNDFLLTADINYNNSLSSANELQIYRIIQEAITNMVKYADAIAGKVMISESSEAVHIEIKDNGKGFNVQEVLNSGNAFGLHNIIERSRAVGGEAKIFSGRNGTVIKIDIPKNQS